MVDLQLEIPWTWPQGVEVAYRELFARVPRGLTWLALHFNAPGEIEAISDDAAIRTGEYEFFRSGQATTLMAEYGIKPVGLRAWRDQMRGRSAV